MANPTIAPRRVSAWITAVIVVAALVFFSPVFFYAYAMVITEAEIRVTPGGADCVLYIDGRRQTPDESYDDTNLYTRNLIAGNRRIRISKPGYRSHESITHVPIAQFSMYLGYELEMIGSKDDQ